ncbi:MAG: hypothetical protein WAK17_28925, partial [Candidatus Nitrosopolaris sp.]
NNGVKNWSKDTSKGVFQRCVYLRHLRECHSSSFSRREGELLIRNRWISVDPYMSRRMKSAEETKSYTDSLCIR